LEERRPSQTDPAKEYFFYRGQILKFLVTGSAGFLGSHLCEALLKMGHKVIGLDNYQTGSRLNYETFVSNSSFISYEQDVRIPFSMEVDGIFNLACPASPIQYQKNPVQTLTTNIQGAINCLELATKLEIPILQASTSEVYGDPQITPQSEQYWGNVNPIGIRSCYDEGKRATETLFFDYYRQFGTQIKVARIFNTYGPRMSSNDGRVVSNFVVQALRNEDITIYGDGNQTRSLCYVDDLIKGLISLFFVQQENPTPVNLGNPTPISMNNLAHEIVLLTQSASKIIHLPLPEDDPVNRQPDIAIASALLGFFPKIDRDEGLLRTIFYFKSIL
jgi:UDP-glucuronate decarboxylase